MTQALHDPERIFAIDLHPQSYGYAVLESPAELLDWGVRRRYLKRAPRSMTWMSKSLQRLLDIWRPSLIVTNESPKLAARQLKKISASLVVVSRRFGIPVYRIPGVAVRSVFGGGGNMTKHQIAQLLVQRFSYLAFTLPPLRRIYESQNYRMSVFAAVALALRRLLRSSEGNTKERIQGTGEIAPLSHF